MSSDRSPLHGLPPFTERTNDGRVPFRVRGADLQSVEFRMQPGDVVYAQPGTFICGSGGAQIDVNWGKSLLDPFRRVWSGEKATIQEIHCENRPGRIVIGAAQIGRIVHIRLEKGRSIYCDRGAYLCHTGDIDISIGIAKKLRAGFFGGNGFFMQRLTGEGDVFLHALGSVVDWTIPEDEVVQVNTRNLLCFDDTCSYDIQFSGGLFAVLFAGQGLFFARIQGPGRVISHSIDQVALIKSLKISGVRLNSDSPPKE